MKPCAVQFVPWLRYDRRGDWQSCQFLGKIVVFCNRVSLSAICSRIYICISLRWPRRKVTTPRITSWRVSVAPEVNTPVRSRARWAFAQFSFTSTPVFCRLTVWRWRTLLKRHKNQAPKSTNRVIDKIALLPLRAFLPLYLLYLANYLQRVSAVWTIAWTRWRQRSGAGYAHKDSRTRGYGPSHFCTCAIRELIAL